MLASASTGVQLPARGQGGRSSMACGDSAQSRRFRHHFDPKRSNQPPELRVLQTPEESALQQSPDQPPPSYWRDDPPGSFHMRNPHAHHTRVTPVDLPSPQGPLSLAGNEYYYTEVGRDYKRDWPSIECLLGGTVAFRPGFLETLQDPAVPSYMYASGVQKLHFSPTDRAVQVGVAAACAVVAAAAYAWLWAQNYNLAAALLVNWARQRLSFAKLGVLVALAACSSVWMYWVFLAGSLVDNLLERIAPPFRKYFWLALNLWLLFLVLGPAHVYPLPFFPFDVHSSTVPPMVIPQ